MNVYKTLLALPSQGVWALYSNTPKTCALFVSEDILGAIGRHMRLLKDKAHIPAIQRHVRSLNIETLSVCSDKEHRLLHREYYYNKYRNMGWTFYKRDIGLQYNTRVVIERDMLVYVYLVNRRNAKKCVGVFNTVVESNEFVQQCYKNVVLFPVYARNMLTKRYVLQHNKII